MSAPARAILGDRLAFCLAPGEQMLGYPVPGADEAIAPGRRHNVVWYRPANETADLPRLCARPDRASFNGRRAAAEPLYADR